MTNKIKNIVQTVIFAVFLLTVSLLCVFGKSEEFSDSERRALEQMPEINTQTISEGSFMTDFESYTLDQFPLRDSFRTIKALSSKYLLGLSDNNGIYSKDGIIGKLNYPLNKESVNKSCEKFTRLYDDYFKNSSGNVYISVIPDKNELMGDLKLDNNELYSMIKENMPFADFIDISSTLEASDYYATDTHWRQESIIDTAKLLCSAMGTDIPDDYKTESVQDEFYGVYYGQSALPGDPDEMKILTNDIINSFKVFDWQNNKESDVYDMEKLEGKDPYEVYLSGPISFITIENPKAENEKELIIFRDSYGSSIAPLIAQGYSKVTLVDIRYIPSKNIAGFINKESADVLFLYSSLVLNNSGALFK